MTRTKDTKRIGILLSLIFVCIAWIFPEILLAGEESRITTLFLVRHAEKVSDGSADPDLTAAGAERADELAYILGHVDLDAVYSTPYSRTKQTVLPTAKQRNLEVRLYNPGDPDFLRRVLQQHSGGAVLIVGHSNTIPSLANELTGRPDFSDLDDGIYDNLFVASVQAEGKTVVLRMRFGARTPGKS